MKAILPDKEERDRPFEEIKSDIEAGRLPKMVRKLEPFSGRHEDVAACCYNGNRMVIETLGSELP